MQRLDLRRNALGLAGLMALRLSMKTNQATWIKRGRRTQEAPMAIRARNSQGRRPAPRQAMRDVAIDAVAGGENATSRRSFSPRSVPPAP